MNTVIYAVRHGETEWNALEKTQGHLDSPLTENGIRQAQLLAGGLAGKNIDILFSSDLGRALRTAEIIAKRLSLDIHTDARLRERNLGIMQGLTPGEFEGRHPEEAARFYSNDPDYVVPGGESLRQLFDRSVECAEDVARNNAGKIVLIVGHGGVLRSFLHKATNTPWTESRRYSLFNAGINSFSVSDGQWRLDTWGMIAHLEGMEASDDY